jgi:2-haloacid dehalogenase
MASKQPVAIVFDTFGTVVDWRSSLIAELTGFGRQRDINADWTALVDAWRAAYHPSMDRVRKGEQPWTTLDGLHRASLDKLVAEFGIKGLTEADLQHINRGWHRLNPWPDSVPGLTRLKRKFIIGPLSNGNVSLLLNMAKNAGIPWDMIFGSDLFGHFKPDPETYLGVAKLLDLEPGQVMMAAAHNNDLANAPESMVRTRSGITLQIRSGTSWRRTSRTWPRSWGAERARWTTITSSSAAAPPDRCSPTGCRRVRRTRCCCWKRGRIRRMARCRRRSSILIPAPRI